MMAIDAKPSDTRRSSWMIAARYARGRLGRTIRQWVRILPAEVIEGLGDLCGWCPVQTPA